MIFKGTMKIFDLSGIFTNGISGVNYGPMMKVICPTLFKRKYDIANDTSMPFNTLDDFFNERDFARAV